MRIKVERPNLPALVLSYLCLEHVCGDIEGTQGTSTVICRNRQHSLFLMEIYFISSLKHNKGSVLSFTL